MLEGDQGDDALGGGIQGDAAIHAVGEGQREDSRGGHKRSGGLFGHVDFGGG